MYESFIYIFEPIPQYAEFIEQRFVNNKKIKVFCCGLARQDSMGKLSLEENASSSIRKKNIPEVSIQYRNFVLFLAENKIQKIDLIKINIEGDEYELLEHLIEIDFLKNINDLQIQFHSFVPKSKIRMLNIQKKLSESHKLTYQFPFIWENWTKKI
jgi:FkbM family methyltransferase